MVVSPQFSKKITVLSFWAIATVAVIHARNYGDRTPAWVMAIEKYISLGLAQWAVPFFFIVSGYWFGLTEYVGFADVIRKKFRTLFVPYLLWTVIGTIFTTILVLANNVIVGKGLLERTPFSGNGLLEMLSSVFGVLEDGPWGEGVLWFVRVLLIFFILSPLWIVLRKISNFLVVIVAVGLIVYPPPCPIPSYYIGFCILGFGLTAVDWSRMKIQSVGWGVFALCLVMVCYVLASYLCPRYVWLAGIPFWWLFYDVFAIDSCPMRSIYGFTFWIFVTHQIFAAYYMAIGKYLLGYSAASHVFLFATTPFVAIALSVVTGKLVKRSAPEMYAVCVGGRGSR